MTMASGAAVMTKLIIAKADVAQPTATRNCGWRAISAMRPPACRARLRRNVRNIEEKEHERAEEASARPSRGTRRR